MKIIFNTGEICVKTCHEREKGLNELFEKKKGSVKRKNKGGSIGVIIKGLKKWAMAIKLS